MLLLYYIMLKNKGANSDTQNETENTIVKIEKNLNYRHVFKFSKFFTNSTTHLSGDKDLQFLNTPTSDLSVNKQVKIYQIKDIELLCKYYLSR